MLGCLFTFASNSLNIFVQAMTAQLSMTTAATHETDSIFIDFDTILALLPYILICAICFALLFLLCYHLYNKQKSKQAYIYTLSPRHFTPTVFEILGNHWQQMAFRTGQEFVFLSIRINNVEANKNMHAELGFCLGTCLREDDIIGDYSLGEFKVLLPCISEVLDYHIVLYRLRTKLLKTSISIKNIERSVTLFPEGGSTFSELLCASESGHKPL